MKLKFWKIFKGKSSSKTLKMGDWESNDEVEIFRQYLRIPSVHPNVNYGPCVEFLEQQSKNLGLLFAVHYPAHQEKPVVCLTWLGDNPQLPSILLNSHMDVVPVYEEYWQHPPFGAEIDRKGRIFGRGAQDMKCVGMQYLGAIRALKKKGITMKRTIHVVYVPDEEIGGQDGMMAFVKTPEFKALNVGFALDEGMASEDDTFLVYYAERTVWRPRFKCSGTSGHGSLLHANTAAEKFRYILNRFLDYRENEAKKLENNPELSIGDVTTVNVTIITGGVQNNVVPPLMEIVFDIRIAIDVDHDDFEQMMNKWCEEAGGGIEIVFESKKPKVAPTIINDSNPFWLAFRTALADKLNLNIKTLIFPGRTDSCFIREVGIPALGFSPMNNTPVLLHDHDEFLQAKTYLRGIEIYQELLLNVANVELN